MVGSGEVDARRQGGGFRVVGLLVDLCLLFALSAVSPLSVKLDGFILPDLERGRDRVHHINTFLDSFDKSLLEHLAECDVVMATESLILLEVLNILFGGISGHCDIFEFGPSRGTWV